MSGVSGGDAAGRAGEAGRGMRQAPSLPITASIFCRIVAALNGLTMELFTPAWMAVFTISVSRWPVAMMNGMRLVSGLLRMVFRSEEHTSELQLLMRISY